MINDDAPVLFVFDLKQDWIKACRYDLLQNAAASCKAMQHMIGELNLRRMPSL